MHRRITESRTLKVARGRLTNDHINAEILGGILIVSQEFYILESLEKAPGLKSWKARILLSIEDRHGLVGQDGKFKLECLEAQTQRKWIGQAILKYMPITSNDRDIVEIELKGTGPLDEEDT